MNDFHPLLRRQLKKIGIADPSELHDPARWLSLLERVSRTYDDADQDRYTVERSLDISSREMQELHGKLQLERDQFEAVLVSLSDGICRVDENWRLEYVNPQAELLFGRTGVQGEILTDLVQFRDGSYEHEPLDWQELKRVLASGKLYADSNALLLLPDQDPLPISFVASPVISGDVTSGAVISLRDMTEKRHAQAKIQQARVDAEAARRAERAKSDFLAVMSHEIRTPMNGVIGMTDLLLETELSPDQRELAESTRECSDHLVTVINDILDFSKIEAGKMTIDSVPFDLRRLIEDTADVMSFSAEEKGLELLTTYPSTAPQSVMGDPGRVRQILLNLVGNALKFTSKGSIAIEVSAVGEESGASMFRIAVHDSGIGIPKEKLGTVFDRFTQADSSTTRRYGGTGLGLAICAKLVGLMGGKIGVDSECMSGSSFWFEIPLPHDPNNIFEPGSSSGLRGVRALVVDPSPSRRSSLVEQLQTWNMDCRSVPAAHDLCQLLLEDVGAGRPYGFVFLTNEECLQATVRIAEIRSLAALDKLAVVVITSKRDMLRRPLPRDSRLAGHLTLPIRQSRLFEILIRLGSEKHVPLREPVPSSEESGKCAELPEPRPDRGSIRVLVAEDNPIIQNVSKRQLERIGCQVDIAENGIEAVEMAARTRYQVIFMDCLMPEMDGFLAAATIRGREAAGDRIPIIAMTASALPGDRDACIEAGMDDYMTKPVDTRELESLVTRWANEGRAASSPDQDSEDNPLKDAA